MFRTFVYEFEKNYKSKQLYIGIGLSILISSCFLLVSNKESYFMILLNNLNNMGNLYIYIILLTLSGYIFGLEIDFKTLKILRSKPIYSFQIMFSKYIIGILYAAMIFFIPFLICLAIGVYISPERNIYLIDSNNEKIVILASQGMNFIIKAYFYQFIASIFVISLSIFLSIVLNSYIIATLVSFLTIVIFNLIKQMKFFGVSFFEYIIPSNVNNIFQYLFKPMELRNKLIILIFYSIILFMLSCIVYRKKEINI